MIDIEKKRVSIGVNQLLCRIQGEISLGLFFDKNNLCLICGQNNLSKEFVNI